MGATPIPRDDTHPCNDCGRPYYERIGSYWLADDDLWRRVIGTDAIVLCPECFGRRANEAGASFHWRAADDAADVVTENRALREEVERLRAALSETEGVLSYAQTYAGLLVQYLPDITRRIALARQAANTVLARGEERAS